MATCARTYGGGSNHCYSAAAAGAYHPKKYHCPREFRDRNSTTGVWVPAVPRWERDFCRESNGIEWEDVLEAKKYYSSGSKVWEWDDLAGREAFLRAKTKYRRKVDGLACGSSSDPSPDLYIDTDICWEQKADPDLDDGFGSGPQERKLMKLDEKIVPTGWDSVDEENRLPEIIVCRYH